MTGIGPVAPAQSRQAAVFTLPGGRPGHTSRRDSRSAGSTPPAAAYPGSAAIRLAAVTTVPDEIRGEEIKAYYVTGGGAVEPGELARYCGERLAAFKVPRYWQAAPDLPRTDSERVIKERLGTLPGPVFDTAVSTWDAGDGV